MTQMQPQSAKPDHPPLSDVIERNIQNQMRLRVETVSRRTFQERMADAITVFSGNMSFVYLHALWFGLWVLLNTGWLGIGPFDPFPYSLLTMIVSLEAILLSTIIMISQNRQARQSDLHNSLNLQISLLSEQENTKVLNMLDAICRKLQIPPDDPDVGILEQATSPDQLVHQIEEIIERQDHRG